MVVAMLMVTDVLRAGDGGWFNEQTAKARVRIQKAHCTLAHANRAGAHCMTEQLGLPSPDTCIAARDSSGAWSLRLFQAISAWPCQQPSFITPLPK